jgi:hypothetical protein
MSLSRKETLVLKPGPRKVPLSVKSGLMFGGTVGFLGWVFLGVGMIFVWIFMPEIHFGLDSFAQGRVTAVESTNVEINETPVYLNRYRFEVDGKSFAGASRSEGSVYRVGQEVSVEYDASDPENSRLEGAGLAMWHTLFIAVFPIVGICLLMVRLRKGLRANAMFKHGELAWGQLQETVATNTSVNDQTVYKFTFVFSDAHGRSRQVSTKTHLTYSIQDEPEEPILYAPDKAGRAVLLDEWERYVYFTIHGDIKSRSPGKGYAMAILPVVTVLAHGTVWVWKLII